MYERQTKYHLRNAWMHLRAAFGPKPKMLPDGFDYPCAYVAAEEHDPRDYWLPTHPGFRFDLPYNPAARERWIAKFVACGWELDVRELDKGNDKIYLWHPNFKHWIILRFGTGVDGATCKKVKIGTKTITYEQTIYEVVCEEGAEEAIF